MPTFEIKMPKLGESITEGTIVSWSVKVGDTIKEDDILFEVNTAKVSAEIPSPVAGKILEILFKEGDTVSVGTVVAIIGLDGEDSISENTTYNETPFKTSEMASETEEEARLGPKENVQSSASGKLLKSDLARWYSPVVLEKAREASISQEELDAIEGTGYLGRVSKKDIEYYILNKKRGRAQQLGREPIINKKEEPETEKISTSISVGSEDEVIPMDTVRRIISDRMTESKKISPHVTNVIEVDVTKLVRWREKNKDNFKKEEGVSLTYMPVITDVVARALKEFPRVNSSVDGYNIIQKKSINIGIAVSLNNGNLIVPVIKNADKLNIRGLAASIATLASRARSNKLLADDIQGGTFTITNFGSFKSLFGTPIINQPEVAILGIGIIEKKPAVMETPDGDVIAVRHKMYLSLSYDHRIIDGSLGGNFLYRIAQYLENWDSQDNY